MFLFFKDAFTQIELSQILNISDKKVVDASLKQKNQGSLIISYMISNS